MKLVSRYLNRILAYGFAFACAAVASSSVAEIKNGFDLADSLVPVEQVFQGGPPRDGIPAIDHPRFISVTEAGLNPEDRILGVSLNGEARAYPIAILNRHEVVNDSFGAHIVLVSYCPLCGSGMVFTLGQGDTRSKEINRTFGVSGLLYNSDVLLYDRQTASLWSQLRMQAISGPRKGERLQLLPARHTDWQDWLARYPETRVLSTDTGYAFDYSRDPYANYKASSDVWFPVAHQSQRFAAKAWVAGIVLDGRAKAYPFSELAKAGERLRDSFSGRALIIEWNDAAQSARVTISETGEEIPVVNAYWFAWFGFYPETEVYIVGEKPVSESGK